MARYAKQPMCACSRPATHKYGGEGECDRCYVLRHEHEKEMMRVIRSQRLREDVMQVKGLS